MVDRDGHLPVKKKWIFYKKKIIHWFHSLLFPIQTDSPRLRRRAERGRGRPWRRGLKRALLLLVEVPVVRGALPEGEEKCWGVHSSSSSTHLEMTCVGMSLTTSENSVSFSGGSLSRRKGFFPGASSSSSSMAPTSSWETKYWITGTDTSFPNNCYTKSVFCIFFTTRPRRDVKVSCFLSDYKVEEGSILQKTGTQCRLFFPSRTSVSCPSSLALAFAPPSAHPLVKTPLNALAPATVRRRRLHLWRWCSRLLVKIRMISREIKEGGWFHVHKNPFPVSLWQTPNTQHVFQHIICTKHCPLICPKLHQERRVYQTFRRRRFR